MSKQKQTRNFSMHGHLPASACHKHTILGWLLWQWDSVLVGSDSAQAAPTPCGTHSASELFACVCWDTQGFPPSSVPAAHPLAQKPLPKWMFYLWKTTNIVTKSMSAFWYSKESWAFLISFLQFLCKKPSLLKCNLSISPSPPLPPDVPFSVGCEVNLASVQMEFQGSLHC